MPPPPRRLLLRLTTICNNGCLHCPLGDVRALSHAEKTPEQAREALELGAQAGCRELVLLRGESTIRPELLSLVRTARRLGFFLVQLQTNGRALSRPGYLRALQSAGVTHLEVSLYGPSAELHDSIARVPGAFAQTCDGLARAARLGMLSVVNVHVVAANVDHIGAIVAHAHTLGARAVQLLFIRPLPAPPGPEAHHYARLDALRRALPGAQKIALSCGVQLTTEAVPLCAWDDPQGAVPDAWASTATRSMRVDDVHRVEDDVAALRLRYRLDAAECEGCALKVRCPKTWASYAALFGTAELRPVGRS
jgi:hypothetical protein